MSSALWLVTCALLQEPTHVDVAYGDHKRHVLDLYLVESESPTALVIYIHGGGFRGGSKDKVDGRLLRELADAGISYASIEYRLTDTAEAPAQMLDAARAVQFLRLHAKGYNLDPERFGATGGSAGAGMSLWLAFRDDLADPESEEPLARESTRLACAAVHDGQTSYNPLWIREHIGGEAWRNSALEKLFGLKADEYSKEHEERFDEISPLAHLTKDDAPVFLFYGAPKDGDIHSAKFGELLKEAADPLGVECEVQVGGRPRSGAFLIEHLKSK